MTPLPSHPIDWWQLRKLHDRTLTVQWSPPTWPKLWLSSHEFDQGCPISRGCGYNSPPPKSRDVPPIQNFFGSLLIGHFCPPPDKKYSTISHYLYYIFVNRIRFYWIGEQYTSLCCWLIQMFIYKPFSLLPVKWTALLTRAWIAISYRIRFMAHRLSF